MINIEEIERGIEVGECIMEIIPIYYHNFITRSKLIDLSEKTLSRLKYSISGDLSYKIEHLWDNGDRDIVKIIRVYKCKVAICCITEKPDNWYLCSVRNHHFYVIDGLDGLEELIRWIKSLI